MTPSGYATPSIYDILMTPGTAGEADVLERLHRRFAVGAARGAPWLEPACGSGRLLRLLAGRGRTITGYDLDPDMIAYARAGLQRRGLDGRAEALVADMASPPSARARYGFAFNPWNSLRHLPDDSAALAHLNATAESLAPGAVYAVGLSLTPADGMPMEEDVWEAARGGCRILQVINWVPVGDRVERAHVQLVVRRGEREEHCSTGYDLRSYDARQWRDLVASSSLTTVASLDVGGRDRGDRDLPYQLEILRPAT